MDRSEDMEGIRLSPGSCLACPRCRESLITICIGKDEPCEIDECGCCGGVWLDHGEWEHLTALRDLTRARQALELPTTWGDWALQFFLRLPSEFNIRPRRFPAVTVALIALCVLIFALELATGETAWLILALRPDHAGSAGGLLTFFTSMFLHGSLVHLLGNMYFLYLFGDNVEDAIGRMTYLLLFVTCGVLANVATVLVNPDSPLPQVGASGAIAGIMAAYLVIFRHARLTFMFLVWQYKWPAWGWLGVWFSVQLLGAILDPSGARTHIGAVAHVGGFLTGLAIVWPQQDYILKRHPLVRLLRTHRITPQP